MEYRLEDGDCLEIMDNLQENGISIPAIVMTGHEDVLTEVRAMKKGVYDYITKPVNPEELLMIVRESLKENQSRVSTQLRSKAKSAENQTPEYVQGKSKVAQKLQEYIQLVAPTDMS